MRIIIHWNNLCGNVVGSHHWRFSRCDQTRVPNNLIGAPSPMEGRVRWFYKGPPNLGCSMILYLPLLKKKNQISFTKCFWEVRLVSPLCGASPSPKQRGRSCVPSPASSYQCCLSLLCAGHNRQIKWSKPGVCCWFLGEVSSQSSGLPDFVNKARAKRGCGQWFSICYKTVHWKFSGQKGVVWFDFTYCGHTATNVSKH